MNTQLVVIGAGPGVHAGQGMRFLPSPFGRGAGGEGRFVRSRLF
jgi:hypothetical protein